MITIQMYGDVGHSTPLSGTLTSLRIASMNSLFSRFKLAEHEPHASLALVRIWHRDAIVAHVADAVAVAIDLLPVVLAGGSCPE
jgi:hypothetical protein